MNRKFNPVILVGALLLIVGVAVLAILASRGSDSKHKTVKALVATSDIPAQGAATSANVQVQDVSSSDVSAGAPTSLAQLNGELATASILKGTVLSASSFGNILGTGANTVQPSITLPKGKQALAIEVGYANGAIKYVVPGNHVDIWVAPKSTANPDGTVKLLPAVRIATDVLVLRTTGGDGAGAATAAVAGSGNVDFLLAVDPTKQAPILIDAATAAGTNGDTMYFTISDTSAG